MISIPSCGLQTQQKFKAKVISATLLKSESRRPEQLGRHQVTPTASAERRKQQLSETHSAACQCGDPLSSCSCAVTEPHHSQRMDFELLSHKGFEMTSLISACCTSLSCKSKHFKKQISSVMGLKAKYRYLTLTLASAQQYLENTEMNQKRIFLNVFCTCGGQWYKPLANQLL